MPVDGDSPGYDVHSRERREKKARNLEKNTKDLDAAGIPYTVKNDGYMYAIRVPGKPRIDFYPTTNRWRVDGETMYGPAKRLIGWYKKQQVPIQEVMLETQPVYTTWLAVRQAAIAQKKTIKTVKGGWVLI
jgi:hypothetical protein